MCNEARKIGACARFVGAGVLAASLTANAHPSLAERASVKEGLFPSNYPILLGFDLQIDGRPQAALVINAVPVPDYGDVSITLPFHVEDGTSNERALFRYGQYDYWTLITFSAANTNWPQQISFVPAVDRNPGAYETDGSKSGTLFLEAEGQIRHFRYRYPNAMSVAGFAKIPPQLFTTNVDAIAISLPKGVHEFAVRDGKLSVPDRLTEADRVFPGQSPDPQHEPFLEIAYEVPPTDIQRIIVKSGVKFLAALAPIVGLFFVDKKHIRRPSLQRSRMIGGSLLFVVLLGVIIWTAANVSESIADVSVDLTLLLLSTSISAFIVMAKSKEENGDSAVDVPDI
jgi:hypothetical protein